MTCIVAVEHESGVILGADSFVGDGSTADLTAEPKIDRHGDIAIGWCGSILIATWMRQLSLPKRKRAQDPRSYVGALAMSLREAAIEAKIATSDGASPSSESFLLVACGGGAWTIQPDFSVYRSAYGYASIGAGADYALGALTVSRGSPRHRVRAALHAAARHSPAVRGPFHLVEVPR